MLRNMKNGKAAGEDGIKGEFLKNLWRGMLEEFTEVINQCWNTGKLPEGWNVARIFPIHKSRNTAGNYREVALLDLGTNY